MDVVRLQSLLSDGDVVSTHGCHPFVIELDAGTEYEFVVDNSNSIVGATGTYGFSLLQVPEPEQTPISVNQETEAVLAEPMTSHRYTFEVAEPGEIVVSLYECEDLSQNLEWRLLHPSLKYTSGIGCGDHVVTIDQPGSHVLTIKPHPANPGPGGYKVNIATDTIDQHPLTLGQVVSDGQPGTRAGNLETRGSADRYLFSITQPTELVMEVTSCLPGFEVVVQTEQVYGGWSSTKHWTCSPTDPIQFDIPIGQHRIEVRHSDGGTGTYGFQLSETQQAQTNVTDEFTTGPSTLFSMTDVDVYQFDATTRQAYVLTMTCDPNIHWALNQTIHTTSWNSNCNSSQLTTLYPGTYQLAVATTEPGSAGYEIDLAHAPAPDQTTFTFGTTVNGDLEELGSTDVYHFAIISPTTITFEGQNCPTGTTATIWANDHQTNTFELCSGAVEFLYPNDYFIEIRADEPGTYTIEATLE